MNSAGLSSPFRRLLGYLGPYRGRFVANLGCMVVAAATAALVPYLVQQTVEKIFRNPDPVDARKWLLWLPLGCFLAMTFKALSWYGQNYLTDSLAEKMVADLRLRFFEALQGRSLAFFHARKTGGLLSRLMTDVSVTQELCGRFLGSAISSCLTIVAVTAMLLSRVNWKLSLPAMLLFAVGLAPLYFFGMRIRRASTRGQEAAEDISAALVEIFGAVRVVKAFARERDEVARMKERLRKLYSARMKVAKVRAVGSPVMEWLGGTATAGLLALCGWLFLENRMSVADAMAFGAGIALLYPQFKNFNGLTSTYQEGTAALARIFQLMDEPVEVADKPGAGDLDRLGQAIRLEKVTFAYPGGPEVLKGLDLEILRGDIVALVGPSGAGKSTLADLLPRFHDPRSGRVLWDGKDVREIRVESLRRQIGIVPQEVFLFHDSISANIAYGRPGATREEIESAAKAAQAHDFVLEQPSGYDTVVGDRGVRLSGGQRQRLAIARAFLIDPAVLILDEATSSLDAESEEKVQKALRELLRNRTAIIIAHRLSTVRLARKIIVLKEGRIEESGSHDELMERGGTYRMLVEKQVVLAT